MKNKSSTALLRLLVGFHTPRPHKPFPPPSSFSHADKNTAKLLSQPFIAIDDYIKPIQETHDKSWKAPIEYTPRASLTTKITIDLPSLTKICQAYLEICQQSNDLIEKINQIDISKNLGLPHDDRQSYLSILEDNQMAMKPINLLKDYLDFTSFDEFWTRHQSYIVFYIFDHLLQIKERQNQKYIAKWMIRNMPVYEHAKLITFVVQQ